MRLKFVAVTAAAVAVISGWGVTQASVIGPTAIGPPALRPSLAAAPSSPSPSPSVPASPCDPALAWLESPGGQEQETFNDDVDTLAGDLETESQSPTIAHHLAFEADARVVRAEAEKILSPPALLPAVNRAAYREMLNDFIIVANLLQPGAGYGTAAQDPAASNRALAATGLGVS